MSAPSDEGPTVAAATPQEQTQTDPAILPQSEPEAQARVAAVDKRFANDRASAALHAGVALYVVADATGRAEYIATKWGWSKTFRDLDSLEQWLSRVGGRP